jgi:hypothetical protein
MKLFRRKRAPTRDEIRKAIPTKNPSAEERGGILALPLAQRRGFFGWLAKKANASNKLEIELDEIGSFVWGLIDGRRSVAGIAQSLAKEYKLNKHEAEASLLEFLDRLRQRGCISLVRK